MRTYNIGRMSACRPPANSYSRGVELERAAVRTSLIFAAFALALFAAPANAASPSSSSSQNSGKIIALALPVAAGGVALLHHWDWQGVEQLTLDTALTVGTAYALKALVREKRPDGSDWHSFPSDTAAAAFAPAAFLWDRYGWEYGLPAYALAGYVGYERVHSKQHHWYDVAASAAIGWGYSELITTRYRRSRFHTDVYGSADGGGVRVSWEF